MKEDTVKILIIDDQESSASLMDTVLSSQGYKTVIAHNGLQALNKVRGNDFDLILLDVIMPDLNGYEVCRRIKAIPEKAHIPVLFITVRNDTKSTLEGFESGGVDYIHKPFNDLELLARVKLHLELKRTYEQLVREKEIARKAEQLKSAFLANVSHEIRTPMNAIIGFTELLTQKQLSEEERDSFLNIISKSGAHLLSLIDDIVDISKLETGAIQISEHVFSLGELMDELYNKFLVQRNNMSRAHIDFIYKDAGALKDVFINTDEHRLRQILENLISNAFKYTLKGEVEMGVEMPGNNKVRFSLRDTGIGIPENKSEDIFHRFTRLNHQSIYDAGGAGLGLSISKNLAEMMNARLWFESRENGGSVFYVQFSDILAKGNIGQKEDVIARHEKIDALRWKGKTILVADDVLMVHEYLQQALMGTGLRIVKCIDGMQAVNQFKEGRKKFDLVIMDLQMPVMNGFEATAWIKANYPKIPIVALTALTMNNERVKARESGFDGFLLKPLQLNRLFDVLEEYLH